MTSLASRRGRAGKVMYAFMTGMAVAGGLQGCSDQPSQKMPSPGVVQPAIATGPDATKASVPGIATLLLGVPDAVSGLPFAVGGKCSLDAVNGERNAPVVSVPAGKPFDVYGWAFDDSKTTAVPAVALLQLVRDGKYYHAALTRNTDRPDVAKVFASSPLVASGISATISPVGLAPGTYDVLIMQRAGDKNLVCPTYRTITIT